MSGRVRNRVLLLAEGANPEWVSVPLIGWSVYLAMRDVADVHLVTQVRNRGALLRAGLVEGQDFTAIDDERVSGPTWRFARFLRGDDGTGWTTLAALNALIYPNFERQVWKAFGNRIRARQFDLVHRVTPVSPIAMGPLAGRCRKAGVPFVIGPLNGGVPWPSAFDRERRREHEWLSYFRRAHAFVPGRNAALAAASAILVGSRHTESEIPAGLRDKCIYLPENGVPASWFLPPQEHSSDVLRVCFVGRMVPYKGPDMLLDAALPLVREGKLTLDFVGDGPLHAGMVKTARALGIADRVTFHGWKAHGEVARIIAECDVFGFPSIREFGGGAVLEAMSLGLAPLVVDYAGPGEIVTDRTGYKVPIGSRDEVVRAIREMLRDIQRDRKSLARKQRNARKRARSKFSWSAKAQQIDRIYTWVLGRDPCRPEFFAPGK